LWQLASEPCKGTKTGIYRTGAAFKTGKHGGKPPEIAGLGGLDPMGTIFNPLFQGDFRDGKSAPRPPRTGAS
jgi:hypothetical protein